MQQPTVSYLDWMQIFSTHRACLDEIAHSPLAAGTVFHRTHVPLPKWFAAIYLMSADKGGLSALRLSQAHRPELAERLPDVAPGDA